jgi:CxxC motif-containing protein (DUF1111 family)
VVKKGSAPFHQALLIVVCAAGACQRPPAPIAGEPAEPLPGLSAAQRARFEAGRTLFDREFTPDEGLGPLFNQARCSSCHDVPALGGGGTEPVRKATRFENGRCDLLRPQGGDNLQQRSTPALAALGVLREGAPEDATHLVDLAATSLFGLGLAEAFADETLLAMADPDDADGDGISGRVGRTPDGRVARFGHKANSPTLRDFIAEALLEEMGLTTSQHPVDLGPNGEALPADVDPASDPELDDETLALLVDYVRYLVPPAPRAPQSRADAALVARGVELFDEIGCARCHVPVLTTAPSDDPVFDRQPVAFYSDFLLHDLGPERPGVCAPGASPTEVRTARLAGLRHRPALLHDGSATSIRQVIERHGGEAAASRALFLQISEHDRAALLRFLDTL